MFADVLDGIALISWPGCDGEEETSCEELLLAIVVICVNVVVNVVPPPIKLLAIVVPPCTTLTLSGNVLPLEVVEDWAAVAELITVVNEFTVCKVVKGATVETTVEDALDSVVEAAPATYCADD